MQPVPVTVASSSCPFATASTRSPSRDVIDRARSPTRSRRAAAPRRARAPPARARCRSTRRRAPRPARRRASLPRPRCRAAPSRRRARGCGCAVAVRYSVAPTPTGSSTTGIRRAFAAPPASSIASTQCSESVPMLSTSDDARPRHLLDLLACMRHHRQRAERERRVRRLVHDDVVRDLVDERLAARASRAASLRQRSSCCVPPGRRRGLLRNRARRAPARPRATRLRRRRARRRARLSPRASSAASVAECVQPAPCVAATSCRSTGISMCSAPSKRWSTGVLAVPAGDDRPQARRARAAARRARAAARRRR